MQGQSQQCQFFISDLNKSNKNKFLYLSGSVLQIWIALQATVLVPYFFFFSIWRKSYSAISKVIQGLFL